MKRSILAMAVAAIAAAAPAAFALSYTVEARVLDVKPIFERVPSTREQCWSEQVRTIEQQRRTTVSGYVYYEDVPVTRDVPRCQTVHEDREARTGYDVRYAYGGREYTMRTAQHPGSTVRVKVDEPG